MIWNLIHDFVNGWGYRAEDGSSLFADDVKYYLDKDLFADAPYEDGVAIDSEKVKKIYDEIGDICLPADARDIKIADFTKISVPLIKKPFPKLPW